MRISPRQVLLTFLLPLILSCDSSKDRIIRFKLSHGLDVVHPVHEAMEYMSKRLRELSGGRMTIDVYPSEQLGSERENLEMVQLGSIDIAKTSAAVLESFVPVVGVYSLPYLFRSREHAWNVFLGPIGKEILLSGTSVGLRGLCYYDSGSRSFYTKERPIRHPEDLVGMKIRVQKSYMAVKMIEILGGSPTPIDWGELYTSLQQGVVDGAENNPPSFYTSHHYEVCKYYYLDEHTTIPDVLLMSEKIWSNLTLQQRKMIQQAAEIESEMSKRVQEVDMEAKLADAESKRGKIASQGERDALDKISKGVDAEISLAKLQLEQIKIQAAEGKNEKG